MTDKLQFENYINLRYSGKGTITQGTVVELLEDRIVLNLKEYDAEGFILITPKMRRYIFSSLKVGDVIEVIIEEIHGDERELVIECSIRKESAIDDFLKEQGVLKYTENIRDLSDEDLLLCMLQLGEISKVKKLLEKGVCVDLTISEILDKTSVFYLYETERKKRVHTEEQEKEYLCEVLKMLLDNNAFKREDEFWSKPEYMDAFLDNADTLYPDDRDFAVKLCKILLEARTEKFQKMSYSIGNVKNLEMFQMLLKYGAVIPDSASEPEKVLKLFSNAFRSLSSDFMEEILKHSDFDLETLAKQLDGHYEYNYKIKLLEDKAEMFVSKGAVVTPSIAKPLFRWTRSLSFAEKLLQEFSDSDVEFDILGRLQDEPSLEEYRMLLSYDRNIQDTFQRIFEYRTIPLDKLEVFFEKGLTVYDLDLDFSTLRRRYSKCPEAVVLFLENGISIDPASDLVHEWVRGLLPCQDADTANGYTYEKVYKEANVEVLKRLYYTYPMAIRLAGVESITLKLIFGENVFKDRCRNSIPEDAVTAVIPENVTEISEGTFKNYRNMKSVIIHEWVTSIGNEAFEGCDALEEVVFSKYRIKFIGKAAFKNCKRLREITIGKKTIILDEAFMNCESLAQINHSASEDIMDMYIVEPSIGADDRIFWGKCAFANCKSLKKVEGHYLDRIEDRCFDQCSSLYYFYMDIDKRVGDFAFRGCYSLEQVKLKEDDDWDSDNIYHISLGKFAFPCKEYDKFSGSSLCFDFEHPEDVAQYPDKTRQMFIANKDNIRKTRRNYDYEYESLEERYNYDEDAIETSPEYWDNLY